MNKDDPGTNPEALNSRDNPESVSRRSFLGHSSAALVTAALAAGAAGAYQGAQDIQKVAKAKKDRSASNAGPENKALRDANPNTFEPPPTDHGEVETFWNSFSVAHRRIQEGGWSRQVNVEIFHIAKDLAGVNMRLTAGGIRELHWHAAAEWALTLSGNARITAIDNDGKSFVKDVTKDDLWLFPTGTPRRRHPRSKPLRGPLTRSL